MRMKLLKFIAVMGCFLLFTNTSKSQNCIPTNIGGAVINLACNQVCSTLTFRIPHIKGTDDYAVGTIPYNPYPYTVATSNELTTIYVDDTYSPVVNMPFGFCFYGAIYNQCVAGSNGLLTFDVSNAAPCGNSYNQSQPIPYISSNICSNNAAYYPQASIMGIFTDLFPVATSCPPDRKIAWHIEGAAPCRKFILNYYHVGMFGNGNWSSGGSNCNSLNPTTFQIVLYESTGIIEVNIERKACNATVGTGFNAILGIQNWARDKAKWAPGKNATIWNESNTAYRFTPSGGGSRYVISELLDLSSSVVATADTATTTAGLLDVSFTNFCPPAGSNQYVVRTTFSACDNPATLLTSLDTITINRTNSLNATAVTTNTACGPPSGTITATVPAGVGTAPYTFVLDGVVTFTGASPHTFTGVTAGPHTVVITDASGGCTSTINVTVNLTNGITANVTPSATACTGVSNGTITVTPTSGTAPYTYSLDGGAPAAGPAPYTFINVASGPHTIVVTDAAGCVSNIINVTVSVGPGVSGNATQSATSCPTATNGSITVDATAGVAPFTYQLDGGAFQAGANPYTFTNVSSGAHTVVIRDNVGCTRTINVTVSAGPVLTANAVSAATSCSGATNGTITVTPTNGIAPYTFSLDGGAAVAGAAPYTFINVTAGPHTVVVTDGAGCVTNTINVTVTAGPALTTTATKTDVLCNGDATGTITVVQPAIGIAPYEYSLDGTTWQASNNFTGLVAGTYTIYYREANGCQGTLSIDVAEPTVLTATAAMIPVVCNGQSDGIITVTSGGGISPYEYSIDGGTTWQSSNVFNVAAGNYTITIRDVNNCTITQTINVTEPAALTAFSANSAASCDGGNDGVITVTASGGNSGYQYSLDGITFQSSNVFNVAPGNYTVTVKDNLGCTTTFNTVVVLGSNFTLTPQTDPTICEGTSTQLQLVSNATQYAWTPSTGLSSTTVANPVANPTVTTTYYVTATLGRCSGEDTVIVNVNAAPIPNAGPDGFICYGQTYQLNASGGTQYSWSPNTYLNNPSIANPVSTPAKDIVYTLSILSDINGCASLTTDQVMIDVTPPIKVKTFPYDTVGYAGDQFQLLAVPSDTDVINYSWSPAAGLSNPNIANPVVTAGAIGDVVQYRVITSTIAGCKGEGYVTVRVYKGPDIYVPTGFTPNGDGKNDKFTPFPVGIKSYKYFRVFNRWGQLIFSTTKLHDGWDGKLGGREQPSGAYVWMIEGVTKDDRIITKKGTVTLIR